MPDVTISLEPVVDDIVLLDPVCGMTVDRAHARHLAEHDGDHLRVLLDRLPDPVHQGAGGVPVGRARRRRCTTDRRRRDPGGPHALRRFRADQGVRATRSGRSSSTPTRSASAARASRRSRSSTRPISRPTAKVGIGFISARFNVNMEFAEQEPPDRARDQGPRPGARQRGRRDRRDAPLGRAGRHDRHGLDRPTSTSRGRWPASAPG